MPVAEIVHVDAQGSLIILTGRTTDGERLVVQVPYDPYFYAPTDEIEDADLSNVEYEHGHTGVYGAELTKITTETPRDVGYKKRSLTDYEADVPYPRRFLVDEGLFRYFEFDPEQATMQLNDSVYRAPPDAITPVDEADVDLRLWRYDIETAKHPETGQYSDPLDADAPITSIAWHDSTTDEVTTYQWHPDHSGGPREEVRFRTLADGREVRWTVRTYGDEQRFLQDWVTRLRDDWPDALIAHNGHYGFVESDGPGYDIPFIVNRLDNLGIGSQQLSPYGDVRLDTIGHDGPFRCHIAGMQLVDTMTSYSVKEGGFKGSVQHMSLEALVEEHTGMTMRKDIPIHESWLDDNERFLEYGFDDIAGLLLLDESERLTEWTFDLARFAGMEDADRIFSPSTLVDSFVLRRGRERDEVLPSSREDDIYLTVEGGYVFEPKDWGRLEDIVIVDLATLYPEVIRACNIGRDTLVPEGEERDDDVVIDVQGKEIRFRDPSVKPSIMAEVLDDLIVLRRGYDEMIENSDDPERIEALRKERMPMKQVLLAVYGTMLNPYSRMNHPYAGAAVTAVGRRLIKHAAQVTEDHGIPVVRGDSDSLFLQAPEGKDPVKVGVEMENRLNDSFDAVAEQMNVDQHNFRMEFEKVYDVFVSGRDKKHYAGRVVYSDGAWADDPHVSLKGVEAIRNNTPELTATVQEQVLKGIVKGKDPYTELAPYVRGVYEAILDGEFPVEMVAKTPTLNFDPTGDYLPNSMALGAKNAVDLFGTDFMVGERVYNFKVRGGLDWLAFPTSQGVPDDGFAVDWDYLAGHFIKPLFKVFRWIQAEDALAGIEHGATPTKQTTLA